MSDKLRIALCITELDVGGAERALVELAIGLDRQRFVPVVYSLTGPAPRHEQPLADALAAAGVGLHFLEARSARDALATVRRLAAHLRSQQPHVLQTFLHHANIVGRLAALRARVPRVVSGIRVAERRSAWRLRLDRWTSRLVDAHVCVSQSVADFSRDVGRLPGERLIVIPNGVDLERFERVAPLDLAELGVPAGQRAMTFVGRLDPQKQVDWLLSGAVRWLDRLPRHDLLIVGQGPQLAALQAMARELGIAPRVHFVGFRDDVPRILAASDALLLTSAWEGMPNVVLEAMASRLPVVVTEVEGVRELLGENAAEQMVVPGDEEAFAERVVALGADREQAARLGAANRRRIEEHFSLRAMLAAYERLYERIAGTACVNRD